MLPQPLTSHPQYPGNTKFSPRTYLLGYLRVGKGIKDRDSLNRWILSKLPVSLRLCQPPIVKGPTVNRDGSTNVSNRVIKVISDHTTEITNPLKVYNTMAIAWTSKGTIEGVMNNSPTNSSGRQQQRNEPRGPATNTPTTSPAWPLKLHSFTPPSSSKCPRANIRTCALTAAALKIWEQEPQ